jgi:DNA-binding transcriptional ArsR family regulator
MSLLPSSPELSRESEPRVVGLDSDAADELIEALSSETARDVFSELHEEPAPPGELAERVGTSLQNAQYHIENLEDAGAIEVVGTAYSEKGREMSVYGPADSPLVIFAGESESESTLRSAVSRLFAGLLLIGAAAAAVQAVLGDGLFGGRTEGSDAGGGLETADAPGSGPTVASDAESAPESADGLGALIEGLVAGGIPPGVAFFLGGAAVLAVVVALPHLEAWVRRRRSG